MEPLSVFIGWDPREAAAATLARESLLRRSSIPLEVKDLRADELSASKVLWRPVEKSESGQMFDVLSGAPMSTEFANSRFTIPFITRRQGWALFVDCDVVCLGDVKELRDFADERFAVMCVQHQYVPQEAKKMSGMMQTSYTRKNWSSVTLWNLEHPAHLRLSLAMVNQFPGELLHRFFWLRDSEIGMLPPEWNWLVGVQPKPDEPKLAHFTLGGPWLDGWMGAEHDDIWLREREACRG